MENLQKQPKFERTKQEQLLFYVEFCRKHSQLLAGKNHPRSPTQLRDLWAEIAANMNAMRGPTRTPAKWKENLGVWKSQLRARARKKKSEQQLTGGGPCTSRMLYDFEERALNTFGAAAVDGVAGIATSGIEIFSQTPMVVDCSPETISVALPSQSVVLASPGAASLVSGSPLTASVGLASPGAASLGSSSPLLPSSWPCLPVAENLRADSPATYSASPSPNAVSFGASSSSNVSLGHSSPRAISQQEVYAVVLRSIGQRDERDERMLQLQLATLQAIEKLAAAIEKIGNSQNKN